MTDSEKNEYLLLAKNSPKRRYAKILHRPGAYFNEAMNFLISDTYMQTHLHPGEEKIEEIKIIEGKIVVLFFDENGKINKTVALHNNGDSVKVPAFAWHTYVVFSENAVTYETMDGIYDPATWKQFADWAPEENTADAVAYLASLKEAAGRSFSQ